VNQNPYAPPGAGVAAAPVPFGQPQPWTASEALTLAWARFKEFPAVLVLAYFLYVVIVGIAGQIGNIPMLTHAVRPSALASLLTLAGILVGQLVGAFLQVGAMRIVLDAARGKTPELGTLFSGGDRFLPMFFVNILMGLAIALGVVFFIVPGIIIALGVLIAPFYVVDAGMGPVDAMKASWAATKGQRGEVFVLGIAGFGLSLLGVLMCCVGWLATTPILYVAIAIAFIRMSGLGVVAPLAGSQQQPPALPFQ
jgi:uncharacterized membrane protein